MKAELSNIRGLLMEHERNKYSFTTQRTRLRGYNIGHREKNQFSIEYVEPETRDEQWVTKNLDKKCFKLFFASF